MIIFHFVFWSMITFVSFCRIAAARKEDSFPFRLLLSCLFTSALSALLSPLLWNTKPGAGMFLVGCIVGLYLLVTAFNPEPACNRLK